MFLDTVDSDITNQKKYLEKDKTELGMRRQGQSANSSQVRSDDAPHAVLTPLLRSNDAPPTPLPRRVTP